MFRVFITSCPYLHLKTAVVKLFEKLLKILERIENFSERLQVVVLITIFFFFYLQVALSQLIFERN